MDWNNWGNDRKKKLPLSRKTPEKIISWETAKQVFSTMLFCSPQAIAQLVVIITGWYGGSRKGVAVTNYELQGQKFSQQRWCILLAWRWRQPARLKRWYLYINLHVLTSQKTILLQTHQWALPNRQVERPGSVASNFTLTCISWKQAENITPALEYISMRIFY